eukprot:COSAG02_NODE_2775_length_8040_cov_9.109365_10_plen_166_part_00
MREKEATERRELYKVCPDFHNYMDTVQKNQAVTVHHRRTVFEWNLKLADNELRLSNQALHYAFAYFDQYLSRMPCPREQLQLVSTAAMWIASKICSSECPVAKTEQLEEIVGINREEIKRMECWLVSQCAATRRTLCTTCIYSLPCKLGIAGSEFCPLALPSWHR